MVPGARAQLSQRSLDPQYWNALPGELVHFGASRGGGTQEDLQFPRSAHNPYCTLVWASVPGQTPCLCRASGGSFDDKIAASYARFAAASCMAETLAVSSAQIGRAHV